MRERSSVPVQRLLALRQYPGFAQADLAELAVIADNVVETELVAGTVVSRAGRVPSLHLIVRGTIEMAGVTYGPRDLVGALEAMAGRVIAAPIIAVTDASTLALGAA